MLAMTAHLPFLNLINNPIQLLSKSGPFENLSFNDVPLSLAATSNTNLILPSSLEFITACVVYN